MSTGVQSQVWTHVTSGGKEPTINKICTCCKNLTELTTLPISASLDHIWSWSRISHYVRIINYFHGHLCCASCIAEFSLQPWTLELGCSVANFEMHAIGSADAFEQRNVYNQLVISWSWSHIFLEIWKTQLTVLIMLLNSPSRCRLTWTLLKGVFK